MRAYDEATAPFVLRSREQVEGFFDGLRLVDPGVVQLPYWRPGGNFGARRFENLAVRGAGRKQ